MMRGLVEGYVRLVGRGRDDQLSIHLISNSALLVSLMSEDAT